MKLVRRWLATSPPIPDISAEMVAAYLLGSEKPDYFAVFSIPDSKSFVQFKRLKTGGLRLEVSKQSPQLEALLTTLGDVSVSDDGYAFLVVMSRPGDDAQVAQVVAQALALLAVGAGVANLVHVRTGKG